MQADELVHRQIADPLVAICGFYYGRVIVRFCWYRTANQVALSHLSAKLRAVTRPVVKSRAPANLAALQTFIGRSDWFGFYTTLVEACRIVLQAIFAAAEIYNPGDKWLNRSPARFGLPVTVRYAYEQLWNPHVRLDERIAALRSLFESATA